MLETWGFFLDKWHLLNKRHHMSPPSYQLMKQQHPPARRRSPLSENPCRLQFVLLWSKSEGEFSLTEAGVRRWREEKDHTLLQNSSPPHPVWQNGGAISARGTAAGARSMRERWSGKTFLTAAQGDFLLFYTSKSVLFKKYSFPSI